MAIFTNSATLSYNGTVLTSNVTTGELIESVTATKTAVRANYGPNENVTYIITVNNAGTNTVSDLTLTDDLGGYPFGEGTTLYPLTYVDGSVKYYIDGVLQPAPTVTPGPPAVFSGISVPGGGSVMLVYDTAVNSFAPLNTDGSIVNTVTATGDALTEPVTAAETVTPAAAPDLTISKSLSPTTVTESGTITYPFLIQNFGNTEATADDDLVLTDTFTPRLENLAVTLNGAPLAAPANYTYGAANGTFSTLPGQITVPAATYTQDPDTGSWIVNPGVTTVTITGTI